LPIAHGAVYTRPAGAAPRGSPMDQATVVAFFNDHVPFHHMIGLKILYADAGVAKLHLPFQPGLVGDSFRPAIHGGVVATLIDVAGGAAVMSAVDDGDRISTIDFRVDFLRPGQMADLFGEARVVRSGARVAVAAAVVHQGDPHRPIAEGRCVFDLRRKRSRTPGE